MRFEELYQVLAEKKYRVFSFEELSLFFPNEKRETLKQSLSRWKKNKFIEPLRKGLYELVYPEPSHLSDMYLANKIYTPSYVSLETALSHYGFIPEVSMAVLSITSKPTRQFKNPHGLFIYRSVQPRSFGGYTIERHGGLEVLIAEPEKALADFLYFKTLRGRKIELNSLRLDRKRTVRLNQKKLIHYGHLYGMDLKERLRAY